MDEDVLVMKILAFQVHQRYDDTPLGPKSRRAQYGNSQRSGKDGKSKRSGENGKRERSHWGNKVDPVVEESNGFEASDYYHIIYQC